MSEQQLPAVAQLTPPAVSVTPAPEKKENSPHSNPGLYKSLLYQYAQRLDKQPPFYQTSNEGAQHKPEFRSRVWVDDVCYTSTKTYPQRKVAETDVSKVAFMAIMQKTKDEATNFIQEDATFCKAILNEYAARMNFEKPTYQIIQPDSSLPLFSSSLVFNGNTYTGEFARNKAEAQRLAARAVILSIIDSESGNVMSEVIKSKSKIRAALDKAKSSFSAQMGPAPEGVHTGNDIGIVSSKASEVEVAAGTNDMPPSTITEPCPRQPTNIPGTQLALQVAQPPTPAKATVTVTHPATSVPPILEQIPLVGSTVTHPAMSVPPILEQIPLVGSTVGTVDLSPILSLPPVLEQIPVTGLTSAKKRNRKNKKKAQKKARTGALLPLESLDAARSTSVAQ